MGYLLRDNVDRLIVLRPWVKCSFFTHENMCQCHNVIVNYPVIYRQSNACHFLKFEEYHGCKVFKDDGGNKCDIVVNFPKAKKYALAKGYNASKQAPTFKFHIMDGNEAHQISQCKPKSFCVAISSPCNKQ